MSTPQKTRYVIAYDISDDSRRGKLARYLLDFGDRVQKSVFEAELDRSELKEILQEVPKYIADDDSLRIYPLCQSCVPGIRTVGRDGPVLSCRLRII